MKVKNEKNWNEKWITSIIHWKSNDVKLINFEKEV